MPLLWLTCWIVIVWTCGSVDNYWLIAIDSSAHVMTVAKPNDPAGEKHTTHTEVPRKLWRRRCQNTQRHCVFTMRWHVVSFDPLWSIHSHTMRCSWRPSQHAPTAHEVAWLTGNCEFPQNMNLTFRRTNGKISLFGRALFWYTTSEFSEIEQGASWGGVLPARHGMIDCQSGIFTKYSPEV